MTGTRPEPRWSSRETALICAAFLVIAALSSYRLDTYPAPWFDEGWYLQVPRNLVEHGEYATRSADQFRRDDTVLSVSPTIYLPIAAAFRVAGIGFVPARLVIVGYLLTAVACCYLLGRKLYGPLAGAAATYLFLFRMEGDPFTSTFLLGRQVMGEVPAIAFVLGGCLAWRTAAISGRPAMAGLAGGLFALAVITKLQFVFIVPPAVAVVGAIAWWQGARRTAWLAVVTTGTIGLMVAGWFACLWILLGTDNAAALAANVIAASAPQVRIGALAAAWRALSFLSTTTFLVLGLPALAYAILLEVRDPAPDHGRRLLVALVATSALWFTLRSIGWPRYAYPMLALGNLLIARLLLDLATGLALVVQRSAGGVANATAAAAIVIGALVLLPLPQGRVIAKGLVGPSDLSLPSLRAWLDREIPAGVGVETWEFEVAVMPSPHDYSFPPVRMVDRMIASVFFGTPIDAGGYDPSAGGSQYLVVGRFAKWTGLYDDAVRGAMPLASFGDYDVYRLPGRSSN
jgi:4-amino-4-deoxy-L-arabinose transferase-like glycosyltransferase